MAELAAPDVDIETLLFGKKAFAAEVPFANESSPVAGLFQCLGEGNLLQRQLADDARPFQLLIRTIAAPRQPIGEAKAGGIFPRENTRASWRTDGARGVGLGESHGAGRETVEVGGLVEGAAVTPKVAPAQIIRQDENNVGPMGFGWRGQSQHREADQNQEENNRTVRHW
jgi:hypothetical protein